MARDKSKLHPRLQAKITEFEYLCNKSGYKMKVTECIRTVKEQDDLYNKGRKTSGNIVTNAKGSDYKSMHQWGVAFDVCRNDGHGAFNNKDGWFNKVGKLGKKVGLEWGGNWRSIVDLPHYQLPYWGSTANKLKSKYGRPDAFKKAWSKHKGTYKVAKSARFRALPGSGETYAKLPVGTVVKCSGPWDKSSSNAVWLQIEHNGKIGFVAEKKLTKS